MQWKVCEHACSGWMQSHASVAHTAAFFKAKVLHRDISVGNIIIHNGEGLLIDWDLSVVMDKKSKRRRQERTVRTFRPCMPTSF